MKIVVTGNIGCGKSTVVGMLSKLMPHYAVFDFDKAVHMEYDTPSVRNMLMACFGAYDRAVISDIVHADPERMSTLRSIMDSAVTCAVWAAARQENVILDIPLFFEFQSMWNIDTDHIICVAADEYTQIERVKARNGWTEEKIRSVMDKQFSQGQKISCSDHIIWNFTTLEELERQVKELATTIGKV